MEALGTATVSAFPTDYRREVGCDSCLKTSDISFFFFFPTGFSEDLPKPNNL